MCIRDRIISVNLGHGNVKGAACDFLTDTTTATSRLMNFSFRRIGIAITHGQVPHRAAALEVSEAHRSIQNDTDMTEWQPLVCC